MYINIIEESVEWVITIYIFGHASKDDGPIGLVRSIICMLLWGYRMIEYTSKFIRFILEKRSDVYDSYCEFCCSSVTVK